MYKLFDKRFLFILNTEKPNFDINKSFFDAFNLLDLPHLPVESISIKRFFEGIKKSITYLLSGYWNIYLTLCKSKYCINLVSCGKGLFLNVVDKLIAAFTRLSLLKTGLLFFILILCLLYKWLVFFVSPNAQCLLPLFLVSFVASFMFLVFNPKSSASLVMEKRQTLHSLLSLFIEYCLDKCKSVITCLKGILKCFSILVSADNILIHYNCWGINCQE